MYNGKIIEVSGLTKTFKIPSTREYRFKAFILNRFLRRQEYHYHDALKEVSFEVHHGERIGLLGRNGSGKSTLLKVLSGIYEPTAGNIKVAEQPVPLIELGAGFHYELSGLDNIYFNSSLFGRSQKSIDEMVEPIIEFSELGEFIHAPVGTYSSGMQMRLGISIALCLAPKLLYVDEVLAVGDADFRKKVLVRLKELFDEGLTLIFVSHDYQLAKQICSRLLTLEHGRLISDEPITRSTQQEINIALSGQNNQ